LLAPDILSHTDELLCRPGMFLFHGPPHGTR
jgi:hypothetical protein